MVSDKERKSTANAVDFETVLRSRAVFLRGGVYGRLEIWGMQGVDWGNYKNHNIAQMRRIG